MDEPTEQERASMLEAAQAARDSILANLRDAGIGPADVVVLLRREGDDLDVRFVGRLDAERIYANDAMISRLFRTARDPNLVPVVVLEGNRIATGHIVVGGTTGGSA